MPAVVIRQRKSWRRRDGVFLYFEVRSFLQPPNFAELNATCLGQRRCYRQPQGRNEGLCYHRPSGERMRTFCPSFSIYLQV